MHYQHPRKKKQSLTNFIQFLWIGKYYIQIFIIFGIILQKTTSLPPPEQKLHERVERTAARSTAPLWQIPSPEKKL
jgi:hypothetical protein